MNENLTYKVDEVQGGIRDWEKRLMEGMIWLLK